MLLSNGFSLTRGNCDVFAMALRELYNFPLYAIRGVNDSGECEYCHAFCKVGQDLYLDAEGLHSSLELISKAAFIMDVVDTSVVEVSEIELKDMFSCQDQSHLIKEVKIYLSNNPEFVDRFKQYFSKN